MNVLDDIINNINDLPLDSPNIKSTPDVINSTPDVINSTPSFFITDKIPKYVYKKRDKPNEQKFADEKSEKFEFDNINNEKLFKNDIGIPGISKEKIKTPFRLDIIKPTEVNKTFEAFKNLSKEQENIIRLQYKSNMDNANEHFSNILKLDKYDPNDNLSLIHTKYEKIRITIAQYQKLSKYKTILSIVWPTIEYIVTNILDIDISGYADFQSRLSKMYDTYLINLSEKYITKYGIEESDNPLYSLILYSLLHLGVFIGISLFIPKKDVAHNLYGNLVKEISKIMDGKEENFGESFNLGSFLKNVAGKELMSFMNPSSSNTTSSNNVEKNTERFNH